MAPVRKQAASEEEDALRDLKVCKEHLSVVRNLAKARQARLTYPSGLCGGALLVGGIVCCIQAAATNPEASDESLGIDELLSVVGCIGIIGGCFALLMCITPARRATVQTAAFGALLGLSVTVALSVFYVVRRGHTLHLVHCEDEDSELPCWSVTVVLFAAGLSAAAATHGQVRTAYGVVRQPDRELLDTIWLSVGRTFMALGVLAGAQAGCVFSSHNRDVAGVGPGLTCLAVECLVLGLLAVLPGFRLAAQGRLVAIGSPGPSCVAGVASLRGGTSDRAVAHALQHFRCVRCDWVTLSTLSTLSPDPVLRARSTQARYGEVDAFLSHGWKDDPVAKWEMLQCWRQKFKDLHGGREPTLWIDRWCMVPDDVDSLNCMPIFMAGCRQVLVLYGPTYLSRLWCIAELLTAAELARDRQGPDVMLYHCHGQTVEDRMEEEAANFEVREASATFIERDCDRLLAVLEIGAGSAACCGRLVRGAVAKAPRHMLPPPEPQVVVKAPAPASELLPLEASQVLEPPTSAKPSLMGQDAPMPLRMLVSGAAAHGPHQAPPTIVVQQATVKDRPLGRSASRERRRQNSSQEADARSAAHGNGSSFAEAGEPQGTPRPDFSGMWLLTRVEGNFEEFMKEMGTSWALRKAAAALGYGVRATYHTISQSQDELHIVTKNPKGVFERSVKLDGSEQRDRDPVDGQPIKVRPCWDGATITIRAYTENPPRELPLTMRYMLGEEMVVEQVTPKGISVKRYFERQ